MVVVSWLSVGYHLFFSDDQVETLPWWVAGGSSHAFVAESPDDRARAVMVVTPQSSLSSSLSFFSLLSSLFFSLSLFSLSHSLSLTLLLSLTLSLPLSVSLSYSRSLSLTLSPSYSLTLSYSLFFVL